MFSVIDIVFIIIILIFAITSCAKGFVQEIFNKISWIVGIVLGCLFAKKLQPYVASFIKNDFFSLVVSFLLIFAVVFLVVQIVKTIIRRAFEGEIMRGLDKSLGFFLGILEGIVFVMLIILLLSSQTLIPMDTIFNGSFFVKIFTPILPSPAQLIKKDFA